MPATMSDDILTGVLRNKLGFDGVICTDSMVMAGVADSWDLAQASIIAINAGADMLCSPIGMKASHIAYWNNCALK